MQVIETKVRAHEGVHIAVETDGSRTHDQDSARPCFTPEQATARVWCDEGLDQVEALMRELSAGTRLELAGLMLQEHLATGGKRLRARLALVALEALGLPRVAGIGWAAACELVHNATLIHDDLQDGDRHRRGHPTVWVRHGSEQAINAGDLMLMLPFLALDHVVADCAVRWRMSRALARGAERTVRGQSLEMDLKVTQRTDWESYLHSVEGKTGALFSLPVEGAALMAGVPERQIEPLVAELVRLGVLFQLQDDILDLYGEKGRNVVGADILEGKISVLVVEHLRLHPGDAPWLLGLLAKSRDDTSLVEVEEAITRFRRGGALQAALKRCVRLKVALEHSPVIAAFPAIHAVVRALITIILKPIAHLELPQEGT